MHLDWNQSSIDSDRVTAEGDKDGDYVQWDPRELMYVHGWNLVDAGDNAATFPASSRRASRRAAGARQRPPDRDRPTATTKGWNYGITGKASHGAAPRVLFA